MNYKRLADRLTARATAARADWAQISALASSLKLSMKRYAVGAREQRLELLPILDQLARATDAISADQGFYLDWQEFLLDENTDDQTALTVLIVKPNLDYSELRPAERAIQDIRNASANLNAEIRDHVRIRLTGTVAMEHEEFTVFRAA